MTPARFHLSLRILNPLALLRWLIAILVLPKHSSNHSAVQYPLRKLVSFPLQLFSFHRPVVNIFNTDSLFKKHKMFTTWWHNYLYSVKIQDMNFPTGKLRLSPQKICNGKDNVWRYRNIDLCFITLISVWNFSFFKPTPETLSLLYWVHQFGSDLTMSLCFNILLQGFMCPHINFLDERSFCMNFLKQLATKYKKHLPHFTGLD